MNSGACDYILLKERLLSIADQILAVGAPGYDIVFSGGEQFLHPWLEAALDRLAGGSVNMDVTIHTSASFAPPEYISKEDFRAFSRFRLIFHVHPATANIKSAIEGIAGLVGSPIKTGVVLWDDGSDVTRFESQRKALEKLSEILPVAMETRKVTAEFLSTIPPFSCSEDLSDSSSAPSDIVFLGADDEIVAESGLGTGKFTVYGTDAVRIYPDGSYSDVGSNHWGEKPLWSMPIGALLDFPVIGEIKAGRSCAFPRFGSHSEAQEWLDDWKLGRRTSAWASGSLTEKYRPFLPVAKLFSLERAQPEAVGEILASLDSQADTWRKLRLKLDNAEDILCTAVRFYATGDVSHLIGVSAESDAGGGADGNPPLFVSSENGQEIANLQKHMRSILVARRPFSIAFPSSTQEFLSILGWLVDYVPGYTPHLRYDRQSGSPVVLAQPPLSRLPCFRVPKSLSVVVPACGKMDDVELTLDSIIYQSLADVEILIIVPEHLDKGAMEALWNVYGGRIHVHAVPGDGSVASLLNAGFALASGGFITFALPGAIYLPDTLANAMEAISRGETKSGNLCRHETSGRNGVIAGGETGLRWYLAKQEYWGLIFNAEEISWLVFDEVGNLALDVFNLCAIFYSQSVAPLPLVGNTSHIHGNAVTSFPRALGYIAKFRKLHGLNGSEWSSFIKYLYRKSSAEFFDGLSEQMDNDDVTTCLSREELGAFASPEFIQICLEDYCRIAAIPKAEKLHRAKLSLDKSAFDPEVNWEFYSKQKSSRPMRLSVILPVWNGGDQLKNLLEDILSQKDTSFELLIIDDASDDCSFDLLRTCEARHSNVFLWRMDRRVGFGVCRNLGISAARGDYLTFVDCDDRVKPGFFAKAVTQMDKDGLDLLVFSTSHAGSSVPDGRASRTNICGRQRAFERLFEGAFDPEIGGKVFRTMKIGLQNLKFPSFPAFGDIFFFLAYLRQCHAIGVNAFTAIEKIDYPIVATSPTLVEEAHLQSAWELCGMLYDEAKVCFNGDSGGSSAALPEKLLVGYLENDIFPVARTWLRQKGHIPLSADQAEQLAGNTVFIKALLTGLARNTTHMPKPDHELSRGDTGRPLLRVIFRTPSQARIFESYVKNVAIPIEVLVANSPDLAFNSAPEALLVFVPEGCLDIKYLMRSMALMISGGRDAAVLLPRMNPAPVPTSFSGMEALRQILQLDAVQLPILLVRSTLLVECRNADPCDSFWCESFLLQAVGRAVDVLLLEIPVAFNCSVEKPEANLRQFQEDVKNFDALAAYVFEACPDASQNFYNAPIAVSIAQNLLNCCAGFLATRDKSLLEAFFNETLPDCANRYPAAVSGLMYMCARDFGIGIPVEEPTCNFDLGAPLQHSVHLTIAVILPQNFRPDRMLLESLVGVEGLEVLLVYITDEPVVKDDWDPGIRSFVFSAYVPREDIRNAIIRTAAGKYIFFIDGLDEDLAAFSEDLLDILASAVPRSAIFLQYGPVCSLLRNKLEEVPSAFASSFGENSTKWRNFAASGVYSRSFLLECDIRFMPGDADLSLFLLQLFTKGRDLQLWEIWRPLADCSSPSRDNYSRAMARLKLLRSLPDFPPEMEAVCKQFLDAVAASCAQNVMEGLNLRLRTGNGDPIQKDDLDAMVKSPAFFRAIMPGAAMSKNYSR